MGITAARRTASHDLSPAIDPGSATTATEGTEQLHVIVRPPDPGTIITRRDRKSSNHFTAIIDVREEANTLVQLTHSAFWCPDEAAIFAVLPHVVPHDLTAVVDAGARTSGA